MARLEYASILSSIDKIKFELDNILDYSMHDNIACAAVEECVDIIRIWTFHIENIAKQEELLEEVRSMLTRYDSEKKKD